MIIYNDSLGKFRNNVTLNLMPQILLSNLREKGLVGGSPSEVNSWNNSLQFMKNALDDIYFSPECQVAIEYNIIKRLFSQRQGI